MAGAASAAHPVTATDASFQSLVTGTKPVVVDFWAAWCGPCRIVAPVIEDLAGSRSDVVFAKLNVDENPQTASAFRVSSIPTLIFFANGEEKGRVVGAVGRAQIERAIAQHLNR
jgi:thioredoxin 1